MKKLLFLFTAMSFSAAVTAAEIGDEFTVGGVRYQVSTATLASIVGYDTDIPQDLTLGTVSYDGTTYQVSIEGTDKVSPLAGSGIKTLTIEDISVSTQRVKIGQYGFAGIETLQAVTVPSGISSAAAYTFVGCPALTTVDFNYSNMPQSCFQDCVAMTEINIGPKVKTINARAFEGAGLTTLNIPKTVTALYALGNIPGLKSITFEDGTKLSSLAFTNCKSLEEVEIPNTTSTSWTLQGFTNLKKVVFKSDFSSAALPNSVFSGCSSLAEINLPSKLTSISSNTFYGCKSLVEINLPTSVTSIAASAFSNCTALEKINLENVRSFSGNSAFSYCSSLKSVTLCNSLTSIPPGTFGHSGLTSVTIPASVRTIGLSSHSSGAFSSCDNLENVIFEPGNTSLTICSNTFNSSALTSVELPERLVTIENTAFNGCASLASVSFPSTLTTIGNKAFYECTALQSVTMPAKLKEIASQAFAGCSSLASVDLGAVVTIKNAAFEKCTSLTGVVIPESVETIEQDAFSGCSALQSATFAENCKMTVLNNGVFQNTAITRFAVPNSVTEIVTSKVSTVYGALWALKSTKGSKLESLTLPDSPAFTTVPDYLCSGIESLEDIEFGSYVTAIGQYAFRNTAITSMQLPDGLLSIGANAFQNTALTELHLPASLESIGASAFYGPYQAICELVIPANVSSIGQGAFGGTYANLETIRILADDEPAPQSRAAVTRTYAQNAFGATMPKLTAIQAFPETAPIASSKIFSDNVYKNVMLGYVEGSKDSYMAQAGWKPFFDNNNTTGADVTVADGDAEIINVYDLNGVLRLTAADRVELNSLPAGIYIVNGEKTIIR